MSHWLNEFKISGKQTKSADVKMLGNIRELENNYVLTENESAFYIPRLTNMMVTHYGLKLVKLKQKVNSC